MLLPRILTVADWIRATNGSHLKDDVREVARLGDGGWLSIQASRYHHCEPRLDSARSYRSIEIGSKGVLEGPGDTAELLQPYREERRGTLMFARVPTGVAEDYVRGRGGILSDKG